jgi:DNA polymerase
MIEAHRVVLAAPDDFDGWRDAARVLAEAGRPAEATVWQVEGETPDLFGAAARKQQSASFAVPRGFVGLAKDVVCHSDKERFALLYALLLRIKSNRHALDDEADRWFGGCRRSPRRYAGYSQDACVRALP